MTADQINDALAFHAHELGRDKAAHLEHRWLRWTAEVERLTGLTSLDGDNSAAAKAAGAADGYSLDECGDWFDAGWSPERAANEILAAIDPNFAAGEDRAARRAEENFGA